MMFAEITEDEFAPMLPTEGAQLLAPSRLPEDQAYVYTVAPFDASQELPMVTSFYEVWTALVDRKEPDGSTKWSRQVPLPEELRHRTLYASWGADDETHRMLWRSLRSINLGSTRMARALTKQLTKELLARLMGEGRPLDISRVIYTTSFRVVVEHTMQAPPLLEHIRELRELVRDHVSTPGGFFEIKRQPRSEEILGSLVERQAELPEDGMAHHLVSLHLQNTQKFTIDQLVGQLWLMVVSAETQATAAANALGMLFEFNEYNYARSIVGNEQAWKRLINESLRLGPVFPASLLVAKQDITLQGQVLAAGRPCLVSYAAANRDPSRYENPDQLDLHAERLPHIAYGEGTHRCQGEVGANQFVSDVLEVLLQQLPADVELRDGAVLREVAGISKSVTKLVLV